MENKSIKKYEKNIFNFSHPLLVKMDDSISHYIQVFLMVSS